MNRYLAGILGLVLVLAISSLACSLSSGEPTLIPSAVPISTFNPNPSPIVVTATSPSTFPTATLPQAATAVPTVPTVTGSPLFSGLSFATTAGGTAQTIFPYGTTEVFIRWNYSNVPIGTVMRRIWYRDGNVVASREEPWSANWGTTGRLTHISLFDYQAGLTPGNYYVVISLPTYGVTIDGNFSINAGAPSFSDLTFSTQSGGPNQTVFPYGTQEVFIRFNYANIPVGTVMQREWYLNGVALTSRSENWSANWGSTGRLTHISLFDRTSGFGLAPGTYRVRVYLRDIPSVVLDSSFVIETNVVPSFSNLRFSDSPTGVAQAFFPSGTKRVYALWDYANVPVGAQMRRVWWRDGVVFVDRTVPWDFNTYGTAGTVRDVFIFDDISGLSDGSYIVEVSIVGQPTFLSGAFTIGK